MIGEDDVGPPLGDPDHAHSDGRADGCDRLREGRAGSAMTDHFELDVDPDSVRAVVRRLRRAAPVLAARATAVGRTPGEVGEQWTGQAATSVLGEMPALSGHLETSSTRQDEAAAALATLAGRYEDALTQVGRLNTRWAEAEADHRQALRDIDRDERAAQEPVGGRPPSRFEREESQDVSQRRASAAGDDLRTRQATLTSSFEELREELRTATTTAARALSAAVLVRAPAGPAHRGAPGSPGSIDWRRLVRSDLGEDLGLVRAHDAVDRVDQAPPTDWKSYLEDYDLEVPADLDPSRAAELVAELDAQLAAVEDLDPAARSRALNQWAEGLDPSDRSVLAIVDAERVGNLDGMHNRVRYAANRVNLDRGIAEEEAQLAEHWDPPPNSDHPQYAEYSRLTKRIEMLERLQEGESEVDPTTQQLVDVPSQVLLFEGPTYDGSTVTDDGRLAVVMGDLDTATQVGTVVPGITNRIDNFGATIDKARNTHDLVPDSATIAWLGYDTPEFSDATSTADAEAGGRALSDFVAGLVRRSDSELTVMAHSYGTLVTSVALQGGMRPDRVVLFGSPGLGEHVRSTADLGLPPGFPIYALRAPGDPVSITAGHGMDPVEMPGVIRLDTDVEGPEGVTGHSAYTDKLTDSLRNIAGVLAGQVPGPDGVDLPGHLVTGGNDLADDGLAGPYNENVRSLVDLLQQQVTPEQLAAFTSVLEPTLQNLGEGREIGIDDIPELTDLVRQAMDESDLGEHLTQEELLQALKDAGFTDKTGELAGDWVDEHLSDLDFLDDAEATFPTRFGPITVRVPDGLNEGLGDLLGGAVDGTVGRLGDMAVDHLPSLSGILDTVDDVYEKYDLARDTVVGLVETADDLREGVDRTVDSAVEGGRELVDDVGDTVSDGLDTVSDGLEAVEESDLNPLNWG